jgi:hypothetical protein
MARDVGCQLFGEKIVGKIPWNTVSLCDAPEGEGPVPKKVVPSLAAIALCLTMSILWTGKIGASNKLKPKAF